jgi:UDP-N-acetylglucosamine 4,6-dehydratase
MKNKKIFITGGAGFLGKALINRLYEDNEICVYSRDESKHYFLKKQYPKIKCVLGSITDKDRIVRSAKGYEVGIFAASIKQISACDLNPIEAINTICLGAINSRLAAEDNNFESACFISTDKACEATTIYGSCKYTAEQSFVLNESNVKLSSCRYGNVTNSTGSVIPLIYNSINNNSEVQLYSENMTRFMISQQEAVDLVIYSLKNINSGVVVPVLDSFLIKDLFELYKECKNLKYTISNPRVGEKIHEVMVGKEEISRTDRAGDYFIIHSEEIKTTNAINQVYSSDLHVISKQELYNRLKKEELI